jgi:hypothetical protein
VRLSAFTLSLFFPTIDAQSLIALSTAFQRCKVQSQQDGTVKSIRKACQADANPTAICHWQHGASFLRLESKTAGHA